MISEIMHESRGVIRSLFLQRIFACKKLWNPEYKPNDSPDACQNGTTQGGLVSETTLCIHVSVHLLTGFEGNIRFVGPESKTVARDLVRRSCKMYFAWESSTINILLYTFDQFSCLFHLSVMHISILGDCSIKYRSASSVQNCSCRTSYISFIG